VSYETRNWSKKDQADFTTARKGEYGIQVISKMDGHARAKNRFYRS